MDNPLENRRKVCRILDTACPNIRTLLNLDNDLLVQLRATLPPVLSSDEMAEIQAMPSIGSAKKDKLLDLLKVKPVGSYLSFMDILEKKDLDLYNYVKTIESKHPLSSHARVKENGIKRRRKG